MNEKIKITTLFTIDEIVDATDIGFKKIIREAKKKIEKELEGIRRDVLQAIIDHHKELGDPIVGKGE